MQIEIDGIIKDLLEKINETMLLLAKFNQQSFNVRLITIIMFYKNPLKLQVFTTNRAGVATRAGEIKMVGVVVRPTFLPTLLLLFLLSSFLDIVR